MDHAEEIDDATEFLSVGTRLLNETYEITDHLGAGGFGLTYLAEDQIGRTVVLKECFPASLCRRDGLKVRTQTAAQQENFGKLIKNFMNEARQLAKLKHQNVVPVLHFFEENDTAYMSLEYIKGVDLSAELEAGGKTLSPERIVEVTTGILRALDYIHSRGLLHRDVAPDNVIINEVDQPVLIDFGASRNETAQAVTRLLSQQLRAVKDGYSPQEFYMPGRQHTPASDLYSLGATVYTLITNKVPADAYNRLVELSKKEADPLRPLAGRVEGYPESFLTAIDNALSLLPKDRPQTAAEMRKSMAPHSGNVTPLNRAVAEAHGMSARHDGPVTPKRPSREPKPFLNRPPSVDTDAPNREISLPRFDPSEPTRVVKPRVLLRSTEPPRAGTVSSQPPAAPKGNETVPHGAPCDPMPAQHNAVMSSNSGEKTQPHPAPMNAAAPVGQAVSGQGQSQPHFAASTAPTTAPTSTMDKVIRFVALAVIAAGALIYLDDQTMVLNSAAERVQAEVVSLAAGPIVVTSDPSATFDLAPNLAAEAAKVPVPTPSQPSLEFAAAIPEAVAEPPVVSAPVGVQTGWGGNGWAVTLNLPLVSSAEDVVFAEGGASPYPAGTILVSVGVRDAGSDPARIAELAAAYFGFADPDTPRLPISVRNPAFDSRGDGELRVDVSRVVDFGAFTVAQRPDGEGWRVTVATAQPRSGLRDGDVILLENVTGIAVSKITDLEAALTSLAANGAAEIVLGVERSGSAQSIGIGLSDIRLSAAEG